jgi:hypothetical protein
MNKLSLQELGEEWTEVYEGHKVRKNEHRIFDFEDIRRYATGI